jgi:hypothetical protein
LLFAELRRSSAATKAIHIVRLGNFETSSSFALDPIRLLCEFRRGSMQNMQQSASKQEVHPVENKDVNTSNQRARRRVCFAPEDKLCSFVLIKPYYEMSVEELEDGYDGRFMSKEFTVMRAQEVDWERQFEVFPSDDESASCKQLYHMFVRLIPAFSEEMFFVDEKGERCHPAHWTEFSRDLLPYLRRCGHIPPGFGSWDSYERHLVWYNEFYQTCITWYDHHFCGFPIEPLPQAVEDNEGGFDGADVDDDDDDNDDSVDNQADSFLETEAPVKDHGCDGSGIGAPSVATLLSGYKEKEESLVIDTGVEDSGVEVVGWGEELEAVTVPPPMRKLKAFGPCNRTRPYLGRRCKENVRYTK